MSQKLSGWRAASVFIVGGVTLAFAGCDSGSPPAGIGTTTAPAAQPPCGEGLARVELGFPKWGGPTAEFTTIGGPLYATARRFEHGGPFDPPQGVTLVFVGPADRPPTFDEQRSTVSNVISELMVREKLFTEFELAPDRYWLWNSSGGDIVVVSCETAGVTGAVGVVAGRRSP
ncbi:MAG: hypothetical protein ACR2HM_01450 [Acidimicrobiales bacterium]